MSASVARRRRRRRARHGFTWIVESDRRILVEGGYPEDVVGVETWPAGLAKPVVHAAVRNVTLCGQKVAAWVNRPSRDSAQCSACRAEVLRRLSL